MISIERREIEPRPHALNKVFLDATFAPNRDLDLSIKQIDLGICKNEANLLRGITSKNQKEACKMIFVMNDLHHPGRPNDIFIEPEPRIGDELSMGQIRIDMLAVQDINSRQKLPKKQRQDRFVATALHTHVAESPPSFRDMCGILVNDVEDLFASTSVFAASPDKNYLVFRSRYTPQLGINDASMLMETLENSWIEKTDEAYNSKGKSSSDKEWHELIPGMENQLLNKIVKDYKLIMFMGQADSQIVKKVSL